MNTFNAYITSQSSVHFTSSMSIQTVGEDADYTQVSIGKLADLAKFEHGKVFLQKATKSTGSEISLNLMQPGEAYPFYHTHKKHEETYLCLSGEGEMQINDKIVRFAEGDVVRVVPSASRNVKNTGTTPLQFICVQVEVGSLSDTSKDYDIVQTPSKFTK